MRAPLYILPLLVLLLTLGLGPSVRAQNMSINLDGAQPDSSAMLDVSSSTKGFLLPRMTEVQRLAILNPAQGLMVFQLDQQRGFYIYDTTNSAWDHILDSTEVRLLIDNLSHQGIDSVLSVGNNAFGEGIYGLDTVVIGDSIANFRLHVKDTTSNVSVPSTFGTGILITSRYTPRIYFENQVNSDSNKLMGQVYELDELISSRDPLLELEGTDAQKTTSIISE